MRPAPCFDDRETKKTLEALCSANQIDMQLLIELSEVVYSYAGSGRREGLTADIRVCIDTFVSRFNLPPK
jgi:hypothetical protein